MRAVSGVPVFLFSFLVSCSSGGQDSSGADAPGGSDLDGSAGGGGREAGPVDDAGPDDDAGPTSGDRGPFGDAVVEAERDASSPDPLVPCANDPSISGYAVYGAIEIHQAAFGEGPGSLGVRARFTSGWYRARGTVLGCTRSCTVRDSALHGDVGLVNYDAGAETPTGRLTLEGTTAGVLVLEAGDLNITVPGRVLRGGERLVARSASVSATVPAFVAEWNAPAMATLDVPHLTERTMLSLPASQPFPVAWSPSASGAGTVEVMLRGPSESRRIEAICRFPARSGAGVVPPEVLGRFTRGAPLTLEITVTSSGAVSIDDTYVDLDVDTRIGEANARVN